MARAFFVVDGGGGDGGVVYGTVHGKWKSGVKGGALPGMAPA